MNQEDKISQFFQLLFDPAERTNFGRTLQDTAVREVSAVKIVDTRFERFCINPLDPERDRCPVENYHSADRPRRADCNVTVFRNILVECDGMEIRDQLDYITDSELPYSTCCYSGGRSIHFIISLAEPAQDIADYRDLARRIMRVLPLADGQNTNPSRTSRFPFHLRDGLTEQTLMEVHGRVTRADLEEWLTARGAPKGEIQPTYGAIKIQRFDTFHPTPSILSPWTKQFLLFGAPEGERNKRLFMAACDCFEKGFDFYEVEEILSPVLNKLGSDFPGTEFRATIRSARARVERAG